MRCGCRHERRSHPSGGPRRCSRGCRGPEPVVARAGQGGAAKPGLPEHRPADGPHPGPLGRDRRGHATPRRARGDGRLLQAGLLRRRRLLCRPRQLVHRPAAEPPRRHDQPAAPRQVHPHAGLALRRARAPPPLLHRQVAHPRSPAQRVLPAPPPVQLHGDGDRSRGLARGRGLPQLLCRGRALPPQHLAVEPPRHRPGTQIRPPPQHHRRRGPTARGHPGAPAQPPHPAP